MSRLLFAAARGARIEASHCSFPEKWIGIETIPLGYSNVELRIHPADEHLQYGPISTAYREAAEHPPMWPDVNTEDVGFLVSPYPMLPYYRKLSPIGKQFYLLLLSEYLADDGL